MKELWWSDMPPLWQACCEEAWQASLCGSVPIGAVVADAQGNILARGRNHIYDDDSSAQVARSPLAHAELNALLALRGLSVDVHSLELYTTMEPCPLCMGAFYMSGVRGLHFAAHDPYAGSVDVLGKTPYFARKPIRVAPPQNPTLEVLLIGLHTQHILTRYTNTQAVVEEWRASIPRGVALGEHLQRLQCIQSLRAARVPAAEAFDVLADELSNIPG